MGKIYKKFKKNFKEMKINISFESAIKFLKYFGSAFPATTAVTN